MDHTSPAGLSEAEGMTREGASEQFDVAVVGAGQAGLAMGCFLASQGRRFVILEAGDAVGAAWRDALGLARPVHPAALRRACRGSRFPAIPTATRRATRSSPTSRSTRRRFDLPVELDSRVRSLTARTAVRARGSTSGAIEADQVVVATGPFQIPTCAAARRHARAGGLPDAQRRLPEARRCARRARPRRRRRQHRLPDREGALGDARVHLAIGSRQTPLPQKLLGRDLFWWLTKTGLLKKTVDSRIGAGCASATR